MTVRVIRIDEPETNAKPKHRFEGQSGVRPLPGGGYVAIDRGRFAGEFHGKRAFLAASRAAGTTTVLR